MTISNVNSHSTIKFDFTTDFKSIDRSLLKAIDASKTAIRNFDASKIPWLRPEDYYAEMVKSDEHMNRIKDQLMFEQKRISLAEQRRKSREAKKYAKQVQAAKRREKEANKKKKTKSIQNTRKDRKKLGFGQEFDWDLAIEEAHNQGPNPSKIKTKPTTIVKSGKRMYKDAKYGRSGGFGPARKRKRNTDESTGDMSGFNQNRNQKSKKGAQRLGKNRRIGKISKQRSRNNNRSK
eukprot:g5167.t1